MSNNPTLSKGLELNIKKDTWEVINSYFKSSEQYLVKHHQDSFNDFINNKIPLTFQQYNPQILYKEYNDETKKYKYEIHIYYGGKNNDKIYISKPVIYKEVDGEVVQKQMYPNECRLRNLTYATNIFCDIDVDYIIRSGEEKVITKTYEKINIGKIPIMLQSKMCALHGKSFETRQQMGECPYDQGGYFVIEGAEKVIVSHERKAENKFYVVGSNEGPYSFSAQIKSVPEDTFKYARTTVVNMKRDTDIITVRMPMLNRQIPLFILFRLLGVESDKEILKYILYDLESNKSKLMMQKLMPSIESNAEIYSQVSAIKYLSLYCAGKTSSHLLNIITTDLFPHVGDSYISKAYYLGYAVNKLLHVSLGLEKPTDRDSFMFKRVDLSGFLLAALFRENYKQFQRDAKIALDTEYRFNANEYQNDNYSNIINDSNIKKIFNFNVIEGAFKKSFKIGTILNKVGLIQQLNRLSGIGAISQLRRINTPGDMIMMGQRKLHSTQYGIICPVETPDGGNIGIKKHLSIMGHITFGSSSKPIVDLLFEYDVVPLDQIIPENVVNNTKIIINGRWIGIHQDAEALMKVLKNMRRNGLINIFTSIAWNINHMEISILTDGGRCCRPLYIMENNNLLMNADILDSLKRKDINWENLLVGFKTKKTPFDYYSGEYLCPTDENFDKTNTMEDLENNRGVIEYLDTDEVNVSKINNTFDYSDGRFTHSEIHPSMIMGAIGFIIPYANHSQAPRNVYGTGQAKQSVGLYISNYRNRFDTSAHVLYYPQRPIVRTKLSKQIFTEELPTGINAIVAIGCYTGYNQEDSLIFNKSSVQRGLFKSCYFKTYDSKEMSDSKNGNEDIFFHPDFADDEVDLKKENNFSKLNKNGFVEEGRWVTDNDVLIGQYSKLGTGASGVNLDSSIVVKKDGYGVVDKVFCDSYNNVGQRLCKVRICTERFPDVGDKFASRHGQKGTIGILMDQEDMPFTKDGIVPDIIMNPHAIPSRMTIGQFLECVMGKVGSLLGTFSDGTPFTDISPNEICNILEDKCGFDNHGDEILYSGIGGRQLKTKLFIGPTYYQRLKHMPKDKINYRGTGKMSMKTKQPPAGRAVGGGLRIGEMERDAIIAHGAFQFLKESVIERSDGYTCHISENTGLISVGNPNKNRFVCQTTEGPMKYTGYDVDDMDLNMPVSQNNVHPVNIPYNVKLLIQECEAMGMGLRLITKPDPKYQELDLSHKAFIPQDSDRRSDKKSQIKRPRFDPTKLNTNKVFPLDSFVKVIKDDAFKGDIGKVQNVERKTIYSILIVDSSNPRHIDKVRRYNQRFLEEQEYLEKRVTPRTDYSLAQSYASNAPYAPYTPYAQEQQKYVRPGKETLREDIDSHQKLWEESLKPGKTLSIDDIKDLREKVTTYNKSELKLLGITSHLLVGKTDDKYMIYQMLSDDALKDAKININDLEDMKPSEFFVLFNNPSTSVDTSYPSTLSYTNFNNTGYDKEFFPSGFETTSDYYDFKPPDSSSYSPDSPGYRPFSPPIVDTEGSISPSYAPPKFGALTSVSPDYAPPKVGEQGSLSPDYGVRNSPVGYTAVSPLADISGADTSEGVFKFPPTAPAASNNSDDVKPSESPSTFQPGSPIGYSALTPDYNKSATE